MYSKQDLNRLAALFHSIENNKPHPHAAPTYRDTPALREMADILEHCTGKTAEVLIEQIAVLQYLAKCYDEMFRIGISVGFYRRLLQAYADLSALQDYTDEEQKQFEQAFRDALTARNRYGEDGCADLIAIVNDRIPAQVVQTIQTDVKERRRRFLKHDPVELSEAYLSVIDEVEEQIDKNKKVGICHEIWHLKTEYLAARGITWRSPAVLNPRVRFD